MLIYFNSLGTEFSEGLNNLRKIFTYLVPGLSILGFFVGGLMSKKQLKKAKAKQSLIEKMLVYQVMLITRLATLQGPFIFSLVAYLLTSNWLYLDYTLILLFLLATYKPGRQKAIDLLQLCLDESALANNNDSVICKMQVR